mmetsp:Transcript_34008/g.73602  ORF Transcript_34008/g.73602 Transcript_34008/m.73602 type:complete len:262 (-) Transcript_34008:157-942(-)
MSFTCFNTCGVLTLFVNGMVINTTVVAPSNSCANSIASSNPSRVISCIFIQPCITRNTTTSNFPIVVAVDDATVELFCCCCRCFGVEYPKKESISLSLQPPPALFAGGLPFFLLLNRPVMRHIADTPPPRVGETTVPPLCPRQASHTISLWMGSSVVAYCPLDIIISSKAWPNCTITESPMRSILREVVIVTVKSSTRPFLCAMSPPLPLPLLLMPPSSLPLRSRSFATTRTNEGGNFPLRNSPVGIFLFPSVTFPNGHFT